MRVLVACEFSGVVAQAFRDHGHDAWSCGVCCGQLLDLDLVGRYGCPHCHGDRRPLPRWANQTDSGQNRETPHPDRWKRRSITYQGIADAMTAQWD